jgi:hypothetical protein
MIVSKKNSSKKNEGVERLKKVGMQCWRVKRMSAVIFSPSCSKVLLHVSISVPAPGRALEPRM